MTDPQKPRGRLDPSVLETPVVMTHSLFLRDVDRLIYGDEAALRHVRDWIEKCEALSRQLEELRKDTGFTIGVGDGRGQMFVHTGDAQAANSVQQAFLELADLRRRLGESMTAHAVDLQAAHDATSAEADGQLSPRASELRASMKPWEGFKEAFGFEGTPLHEAQCAKAWRGHVGRSGDLYQCSLPASARRELPDPVSMHGAYDEFGGSDFPDVPLGVNSPTPAISHALKPHELARLRTFFAGPPLALPMPLSSLPGRIVEDECHICENRRGQYHLWHCTLRDFLHYQEPDGRVVHRQAQRPCAKWWASGRTCMMDSGHAGPCVEGHFWTCTNPRVQLIHCDHCAAYSLARPLLLALAGLRGGEETTSATLERLTRAEMRRLR